MASGRVLWLIVVLAGVCAAQNADEQIRALMQSPGYASATRFLKSDHSRFVADLIRLTEIPAPPFKEQARAKAYLQMLAEHGLSDVEADPEGNVMGIRKGKGSGPMLAVLAHLDTVFPEGTDVKVKRSGTRLSAPGVGDDTRGLSVMLQVIRAMKAAEIDTVSDILFVGDVGEEGEGDLRGARYLLTKGKYKDRVKQFIAIDGGGDPSAIVTGGVGSKRYQVTFSGPGGHSYGAFGLVNPAYAMATAMSNLSRVKVPNQPKTTFNVGVVSGGTSVNSIPVEVSMVVDLRSESREELNNLVDRFAGIVHEAAAEENRTRSTAQGQVKAAIKLIGDRGNGVTATELPLVQAASAVVRAFGGTPRYIMASTDANVPMSLGIPAITIERGPGGRQHSLEEWVDVDEESSLKAAGKILLLLLATAGVSAQK